MADNPKNRQGEDAGVGTYAPSEKDQATIKAVYDSLADMVRVRNMTYPQFNDRTLKTYLDDSAKIINQYTPDRDSYDPPKEDWQSNVAKSTVRDKQMKVLAGFALNVPGMHVIAKNEDNLLDIARADVASNLVRGSYLEEENPTIEAFWEGWTNASKGTIVKYEGYMKNRVPQKFIKSYDIVTGEIEVEEREVDVDDQCYSYIVPLLELYIDNFKVHDIQDQEKLAWVQDVSKMRFDYEFGKYANAKFVKTAGQITDADTQGFYSLDQWKASVKSDRVQLVKFYCKMLDQYVIIANGVLLLDAPLLWSVNKKKVYPFAKTIWSPFVDKEFFYGRSHADVMAGDYENWNTLWNTITDKEFRALVPGILVGLVNQDAMNLEDELIMGTTKISVPDVTQVKEMPSAGVTNADVLMLNLIGKSFEEQSPSVPNILGNKEATAREVVIAEDKLREMKVLFNEMLTDLWRQKYQLRLANIALNYPQPRKTTEKNERGELAEKMLYRTYIIEDAELNRLTGETGILAIQFRDVPAAETKRAKDDVSAEEKMMKDQGVNYKKLILPTDYFNNWRFQVAVLSESLYRSGMAHDQATILEKLDMMAKYFPQIFVINQEDYFKQFAKAWKDSPGKYLAKVEQYKKDREAAAQAQQKAAQAAVASMPASMKPPADMQPAAMRQNEGQGGQAEQAQQ